MLCPLDIFLSILFFRKKDEDQIKEPAPEPLNLTPLHFHLTCEGRENEMRGGRCFDEARLPNAGFSNNGSEGGQARLPNAELTQTRIEGGQAA